MERIGQRHCGSLRVIATGEPDRVYLCHCNACQRRTGTAFHFGASYPKDRVRLEGQNDTGVNHSITDTSALEDGQPLHARGILSDGRSREDKNDPSRRSRPIHLGG
jgi:hypothetical protein